LHSIQQTNNQNERDNMKNQIKTILAVLALGVAATIAGAQDSQPPMQQGQGGPGKGHRPPPNPICQALDVNHDHVIDADEIANAPAALKALDKNGDGKLTEDEIRPAHPPGGMGGGEPGNGGAPQGPPPGDQ
jgi:hypothetical protein